VLVGRQLGWLGTSLGPWEIAGKDEGGRREGNWRLGSRELMSWLGASIAPVFEDKIVVVPIGLL
jgi:hypothetical protein